MPPRRKVHRGWSAWARRRCACERWYVDLYRVQRAKACHCPARSSRASGSSASFTSSAALSRASLAITDLSCQKAGGEPEPLDRILRSHTARRASRQRLSPSRTSPSGHQVTRQPEWTSNPRPTRAIARGPPWLPWQWSTPGPREGTTCFRTSSLSRSSGNFSTRIPIASSVTLPEHSFAKTSAYSMHKSGGKPSDLKAATRSRMSSSERKFSTSITPPAPRPASRAPLSSHGRAWRWPVTPESTRRTQRCSAMKRLTPPIMSFTSSLVYSSQSPWAASLPLPAHAVICFCMLLLYSSAFAKSAFILSSLP